MYSLVCLVIFFSLGKPIIVTAILPCQVLLENLNFTLFTRQTAENGVDLKDVDSYSSVVTNDHTKIIIHSWYQNSHTPSISLIKDTYLIEMSANVIMIDWSAYSGVNYDEAVCAVPYIGNFVGDLISNLVQTIGLILTTVDMTGFSFGAHIGGASGQRVSTLTGSKIGRINGLDAAATGFLNNPINKRLDSSDALCVQAIHTNNQRGRVGVGYPDNYGTIDFHVNYNAVFQCGSIQPGCPLNPGVPNNEELMGKLLPLVFCYNIRAVLLFIESISSPNFLAVQCRNCTAFGAGLCSSNSEKTIMGEMCPSDQTGVRYLKTNGVSPYAQG